MMMLVVLKCISLAQQQQTFVRPFETPERRTA